MENKKRKKERKGKQKESEKHDEKEKQKNVVKHEKCAKKKGEKPPSLRPSPPLVCLLQLFCSSSFLLFFFLSCIYFFLSSSSLLRRKSCQLRQLKPSDIPPPFFMNAGYIEKILRRSSSLSIIKIYRLRKPMDLSVEGAAYFLLF